jgi:hypothetical protein
MNTAQIQCDGCKRWFTPRGLSQHVSKTRNVRCRMVHAAAQDLMATSSVTHAVLSQVPDTILLSSGPPEEDLLPHETRNGEPRPSGGEFSVSRISATTFLI